MKEDSTLKAYRRIHKFRYPTDAEESKIRRETHSYRRQSQTASSIMRQLVRDPGNEDLLGEVLEAEHRARKDIRNAKTHKKRLMRLKKAGLE